MHAGLRAPAPTMERWRRRLATVRALARRGSGYVARAMRSHVLLAAVVPLFGCSAPARTPTARDRATSAASTSAPSAPPPGLTRADVDALLEKGLTAWTSGDDEASVRSLREAGRGLARLGDEPVLVTVFPTALPLVVAEDELVVPACFRLATEDCALLDVRLTQPSNGGLRRARIARVLHRSEQPIMLRSSGRLPFVAFSEGGAWLHPTVDERIDLGPGVEEAFVGATGRAALVVRGALRVIDTTHGTDLLEEPLTASAFSLMTWAKNGAWFSTCSNLEGPGYVIDAASGAVLFQKPNLSACALDESAGIVAYVSADDAQPMLRTQTLGETKERGSTPIVGVPSGEELSLRLDAARHVVGIRHEPYPAGYTVTSYGNYDIRSLKGAAPPATKAPSDPYEGLPIGSTYQGVEFPVVAPFAKLATTGHVLVESGMIGLGGRDGYRWTGGRSPDGRSAVLLEDLPGSDAHDRALLIVDRKTTTVRARVPVSPRWITSGEWEIVMFLDDHLIVVRSGSDQWFVDADTGTILFTIPTGGDMGMIVPTLLPNGLLAQTDAPGLSLFDLRNGKAGVGTSSWTAPSQLAPFALLDTKDDWTEIRDGDSTLFLRSNGELEKVDGETRRRARDEEVPPWLLCKVDDAFYPLAVCRGARGG